ncbi:hypothetical protein AAW02_22460 [Aeromonas dhakensis]|nr:hypothetical protein AAW02_22460 [Aeromonas dhakensis]PHS83753.1 hypothetical protein AAW03_19145 [Aeromonas dhakensis]TNI53805.1 hypothetical protein CF126_16090 [Aeromonas dhakensis]
MHYLFTDFSHHCIPELYSIRQLSILIFIMLKNAYGFYCIVPTLDGTSITSFRDMPYQAFAA